MRKIGIMGGTFDPIHLGHINIAREAYNSLVLDEVWFMPAGDPPHKDDSVTDKHTRAKMVELAIIGEEDFFLSTHELKKETPSYSAVTFTELTERYEDCDFYFIMGADSFVQLESWYHPEIVCAKAKLVVAARPGYNSEELEKQKALIEEKYNAKIFIIPNDLVDISSTEIRTLVKKGNEEKIREYLADDVYDYILENNLYND